MMKIKIYLFLVLFLSFSVSGMSETIFRKKKASRETKKEQAETKSAYEKLFEGKSVQTAKGIMTLHFLDKKIYMEFPLLFSGRQFLLTSSIEKTSDAGEGIPGQWSGKPLYLEFVKTGSSLEARAAMLRQAENKSGSENLQKALESANMPGIYKMFKIETYTPDSTAVVVDVTEFFTEDNHYTRPFPNNASNGVFGLVARSQNFERGKTFIQGVKAFEKNVAVNIQMGYTTMNSVMGMSAPIPTPITLIVNRMLYLLPETIMPRRLADSRIGVSKSSMPEIQHENSAYKQVEYVRRWRIEPSDRKAYDEGRPVKPVHPIIFYLDTLMPQTWRKYVKEGIEAWNPVFEKIGFKDVIQVLDFPRDKGFDASNIQYSTIWFSPSWMYSPSTTTYIDSRSGEILNASIYVPTGMMDALRVIYVGHVMGSDPNAHAPLLPETVMGELIKHQLTYAMGKCLGLTSNVAAAHAYPVDSLRSATFTQKYGLSSSIMSAEMEYNYIAQPEDVAKGVLLIPKGPEAYDDYAIRWLYKPIAGAKTPEEEKPVLDEWIKEQWTNPWLRYKNEIPSDYKWDPTAVGEGLGDDHLKGFQYWMENMKRAIHHGYDWYRAPEDRNYDLRSRLSNSLMSKFIPLLMNAISYVGGVNINDVYGDDPTPFFTSVPVEKQEEVIRFLSKMVFMDFPEFPTAQFETGDYVKWTDFVRNCAIGSLYLRFNFILASKQVTGEGYDIDKYIQNLFNLVWDSALKGREATESDLLMQYSFVASMVTTSNINSSPIQRITGINSALALANCPVKIDRKLLDNYLHNNELSLNLTRGLSGGEHAQKSLYVLQALKVSRTDAPAIYFGQLKKCQELLQRVIPQSTGNTKASYERLLFQINNIMKAD